MQICATASHFFLPRFFRITLRFARLVQQIPSLPEPSFLEICCAIHFSTEWETFFLLREFGALPAMVLPNQCKGIRDSCAKMLIHLAVEGNRTSWAGQTPRTVNYTVSNFLFIRPCWKCIISSTNVLLWKRWEELYKRFFLPCLGLFAPTLETQLSCFWNPQSIFIVFFPISFQFIATSCCPECSSLLAVCF